MQTERIRNFETDKIFLLGLFVLSLLVSWFIVRARHSVVLSAPVELSYGCLSIRMPDKNGWQSEDNWQHFEDTFVIRSFFVPNRFKQAKVICTYRLAADRDSAATWLEREAEIAGGKITASGITHQRNLNLDWVYLEDQQLNSNMISATADLGLGRWLDIKIEYMNSEKQFIRKVFENVVESIQYEDNELLRAGIEIVDRLKASGITKNNNYNDEPVWYLVYNSAKRDAGFAMEAQINRPGAEIEIEGFIYLRNPINLQQATLFQGDIYLQEYLW